MAVLLLLLAALWGAGAAAKPSCPTPRGPVVPPNLTDSGFLPIDDQGSQLFFLFVEREAPGDSSAAPITLWLQVIRCRHLEAAMKAARRSGHPGSLPPASA